MSHPSIHLKNHSHWRRHFRCLKCPAVSSHHSPYFLRLACSESNHFQRKLHDYFRAGMDSWPLRLISLTSDRLEQSWLRILRAQSHSYKNLYSPNQLYLMLSRVICSKKHTIVWGIKRSSRVVYGSSYCLFWESRCTLEMRHVCPHSMIARDWVTVNINSDPSLSGPGWSNVIVNVRGDEIVSDPLSCNFELSNHLSCDIILLWSILT